MVFNDGEWHTFKLIRETTGWEMTIDDYNCINAPYDDLNLDLDRLLGPQSTVTMSVFTNGDPAKHFTKSYRKIICKSRFA